MRLRFNIILFLVFVSVSLAFAQLKQYQAVKKESFITYKLTHPLHEIEATSKESYCAINADAAKKEIKNVMVQVDVTSFNSGNSNRDSHAMETVDAISYPDSRFTSTSVYQEGDSLKIHGKLTFHGVTKDIYIAAVAKWSEKKLIVNGNFDISLTAFKVPRPSLLLIPVEDTLRFTLMQVFNL
ncbi:MAG: YceI family protein [Ignavibacteriaceae bacterium]|nr:YceI family protein [Ignavibacteriaceae bacterium]